MARHITRRVAFSAAALTSVVVASCSRKSSNNTATGDTGSAAGNIGAALTDTTHPMGSTGMMSDTGHMKGIPGMSGPMMSRSAPRDSNDAFLRMRADRQQGLIAMADSAMPKLDAAGKATASKIRAEQHADQQKMLRMLMTRYKDSITPTVMPSTQQMIATVAAAPSSDADRVFYQQVIAHHQECVQMGEQMLPHLTRETKQLATASIAQQKKEIADLQKKVAAMH